MFAHDVIMTEELNEKQFPSIEEAEPTEEGGQLPVLVSIIKTK